MLQVPAMSFFTPKRRMELGRVVVNQRSATFCWYWSVSCSFCHLLWHCCKPASAGTLMRIARVLWTQVTTVESWVCPTSTAGSQVTGAVSCAGLLRSICWNKQQVCAELELLMKCDSAAFPSDPTSALRAPSEKQTSCHLCSKPGNSRENFLSEVKLLQRLNLPSPLLLLLYVVFLIILSLRNFQASDSTGSDAVLGQGADSSENHC